MSYTKCISIEDWINSPETQARESYYKEWGLIDEDSSWDDFEIVDSMKAYETYPGPHDVLKIENVVYALSCPGEIQKGQQHPNERLLSSISNTLYALRIAAISTKPEGAAIGHGKLIIQSRMPISIEDDEFNPSMRKIFWYGAIIKMGGR